MASTQVSANADNVVNQAIQVIHSGGDPLGDDTYVVPKKRSAKHAHKSNAAHTKYVSNKPSAGATLMNSQTQVTWYASHDLKNPQCGDGSWNPGNGNHIGAVMAGWSSGPHCGEFVDLCNDSTSKCIMVRIVDRCAGCKADHIDLTKSAFKQLAPSHSLDEGVVHGLKLYRSGKPNPWDFDLFGPVKLQ